MRFDRIALDFLDWVRRVLWHRKGEIKIKPYELLEPAKRGKYGMLSRVDRPTARAVETYIFSPYRYDKKPQEVRDIHICCDHLSAIAGEGAIGGVGAKAKTHRISVFDASHWLSANGDYDVRCIYSADFDLQRQDSLRDRNARLVMARLATCVRNLKPSAIAWKFEVETTVKEIVAAQWNAPTPEASDDPLVVDGRILDGEKKGKRVRITVKRDT